jgi:hypothetical protein
MQLNNFGEPLASNQYGLKCDLNVSIDWLWVRYEKNHWDLRSLARKQLEISAFCSHVVRT